MSKIARDDLFVIRIAFCGVGNTRESNSSKNYEPAPSALTPGQTPAAHELENGMISDAIVSPLPATTSSATAARRLVAAGCVCAGLLSLAACGGQSDSQKAAARSPSQNGGTVAYSAGVFQPYKGLASQCAAPRSGIDPNTHQPYPDTQGSVASENNWLRSWINDTYLWYGEVPDLNPNGHATLDYFDLLKTSAVTASGAPKDKFHFTYPTAEWEALSQAGVAAGYGAQWFIINATPPREVVVAYVEPGSPAATAGVKRGDSVLEIDGADAVSGDTQAIVDALNAGLFPGAGQSHEFVLEGVDGVTRTLTLQSANITSKPVLDVATIPTASGPVGYILFNDHIATAEQQLVAAIGTLQGAGVVDLVLDIRYNGGGYLDIASELAYMVAGPSRTAGMTFERLMFNDKYANTDPVTGQALTPTPFHTVTQDFSAGNGNPLPTLNLGRVFVLTGSTTCSASESIINSLRGVDVDVIQIGGTTCGKPYGFYATPNCGTTYFAIQFKGVNAKSFGDYTDGFSPQNTLGQSGEQLPGCSVQDDFTHALGDVDEARLATALGYRLGGSAACPTPPSGPVAQAKAQLPMQRGEGFMHKLPWLENRILRER
jgi:carboxyl-terminal processing protease